MAPTEADDCATPVAAVGGSADAPARTQRETANASKANPIVIARIVGKARGDRSLILTLVIGVRLAQRATIRGVSPLQPAVSRARTQRGMAATKRAALCPRTSAALRAGQRLRPTTDAVKGKPVIKAMGRTRNPHHYGTKCAIAGHDMCSRNSADFRACGIVETNASFVCRGHGMW